MSPIAERIRGELENLDESEREELALFLIRSLHTKADAAWDDELARRGEEIRSGRVSGEPAEKVFEELRAKYS